MSMDVKAMLFDIIAKDNASHTFSKVGREAEGAGTKTHKFGKVAGIALAGAAVAAAEFGKKSVEAYSDAAKESLQLARVTGMTTKEASRLRFAAEESGVEFSSLQKSMQKFSKAQSTATGQFSDYEEKVKEATAAGKDYHGHLGSVATAYARLGVSLKDAQGKALPMQKVMMETADEFKKMPDGPNKTALAMQLFGKSGTDMIKILNKGSEGIKELGKESDKTGNTIGNTENLKKNIQAQREFHAAITGLMITIGSLLMPVITKLSVYMTEHVAPAFTKVGDFLKTHTGLIKALTPVVVALVAAFVGFKILRSITSGFAALNLVMAANPIGLVVVAIAALAAGLIYAYKHSETFRKIVDGAFKAIGDAAKFLWTGVIRPYFHYIIDLWFAVAGALVNGAAKAFGWVPGLGPKLKKAAAWFNDFKTSVNNQLDGIKDKKVKISAPGADGTISRLQTLNNLLNVINNKKQVKVNVSTPGMFNPGSTKHKALGGRFGAYEPLTVGEGGTEQVMFDRPGMVVPHRQRAGGGSSGGMVIHLTVNGAIDKAGVGRTVVEALNVVFRQQGIKPTYA